MSCESPLTWTSLDGYDEECLRGTIGRLKGDLTLCEKPKCTARRHFSLALVENALGLRAEAEEDLRKAFQHVRDWAPENDDMKLRKKVMQVLLSQLASDLGMEAEDSYPSVVVTGEERAMLCYLKGKFFMDSSHPWEAEEQFNQSLCESPEHHFALISLGMSLRAQRKRLDPFLAPDAREQDAFKKKLDKTGDRRAASRLATTMLHELNAKNLGDCNARLPYQEFKNRWKAIVELADSVASAKEAKATDLSYIGDIFVVAPYLFKKRAAAESVFKRALELDPNASFAHHKLGKLMAMNGKVEEGLEHLRKAFEVHPNFPALVDYMGVKFFFEKDGDLDCEFKRAKEEMVGDQSSKMVVVTVYHAQYKALKGDFEGALGLLEEAAGLQMEIEIDASTQYEEFPPARFSLIEPRKNDGKRSGVGNSRFEAHATTKGFKSCWRSGGESQEIRSSPGVQSSEARWTSRRALKSAPERENKKPIVQHQVKRLTINEWKGLIEKKACGGVHELPL